MNLFLIHTPFQLFVAHQIINYKGLKDNMALFGYVGSNRQFYDIYDYMEIKGIFIKSFKFDNLETWALAKLHNPLRCIKDIRENYSFLKSIISDYGVRNLYIGDINNFSCRFCAYMFGKQSIRIIFYEEGSSHYEYQRHVFKFNKVINNLLTKFYDYFLYEPVMGCNYAQWRFKEDIPYEMLPIFIRYSILDIFHEEYDEQIKVNLLLPPKVKQHIESEIQRINIVNTESFLYISSPIFEEFGQLGYKLFLDFLNEYFDNTIGLHVFVKYHPRDTDKFKQDFENILKNKKITYTILSNTINIPLEYYLQVIHFSKMITFLSSVSFYNGYIYPYTKIEDLAMDYLQLCAKNNIPNIDMYINLYRKLSEKKEYIKKSI